MPTHWIIEIKNVGKPAYQVCVYNTEGFREIAKFKSAEDAETACSIIRQLRIDSAFETAIVKKLIK